MQSPSADYTFYRLIMNSLTGGTVCLLAVLGALGMVLHGSKNKKQLKGERKDGK